MSQKLPIGVLDSGVGGLTVLKELAQLMPNESFIYLGDSGRAPYGPRPVEEIAHFTEQIIDFLLTKPVKAIVIACNTITVTCLEELQLKYPVPVIGMNLAGQAVHQISTKRSVAVLGTAATIASGKHEEAIHQVDPEIRVFPIPCYDFAALVEAGHIDDTEALAAIAQYLTPVRGEVDSAVLGCTHYPFLRPAIEHFMGPEVTVIDPAKITAEETRDVLEAHDLLTSETNPSEIDLYFTGDLANARPLIKLAHFDHISPQSHQW